MDIDHNVNNEADGPFKWIYVIIGTDFCCIRVFIIIGLSIFNTSVDKPDPSNLFRTSNIEIQNL